MSTHTKLALTVIVALGYACSSTRALHAPPPSNPKVEIGASQVPQLQEPQATWLIDALRAHSTAGQSGLQAWIERFPDRAAALIEAAPTHPALADLARQFDASVGPAWRRAHTWVVQSEHASAQWPLAAIAAAKVGDAELLWRALASRDKVPTDKKSRAMFEERVIALTLARGSSSLALARCDALEATAVDAREHERLRKSRALALLAMGRGEQAELIAAELEHASDPAIAASALALRASIHANAGRLDRAREFYERALASDADWTGATRARADLALVRLQLDDAERGAKELDQALTELEARSDWRGLARALQNKAAWLASLDRRDEAGAVERRARELIAQRGLSID